jgi:hypothetical protein
MMLTGIHVWAHRQRARREALMAGVWANIAAENARRLELLKVEARILPELILIYRRERRERKVS